MLMGSQDFEAVFRESMISALKNVLGDGGMKAVLFHLELGRTDNPRKIHEKLSSLFRSGTPVLERAIAKELYSNLKIPYNEISDFDFAKAFDEAQAMSGANRRGARLQ